MMLTLHKISHYFVIRRWLSFFFLGAFSYTLRVLQIRKGIIAEYKFLNSQSIAKWRLSRSFQMLICGAQLNYWTRYSALHPQSVVRMKANKFLLPVEMIHTKYREGSIIRSTPRRQYHLHKGQCIWGRPTSKTAMAGRAQDRSAALRWIGNQEQWYHSSRWWTRYSQAGKTHCHIGRLVYVHGSGSD